MTQTRYQRKGLAALAVFSALMGLALHVQSATLAVEQAMACTDGGCAIPVVISAGAESVVALQFDVHYDPSRFAVVDVVEGEGALLAAKETAFSEISPGVVRVVVAGMNNQELEPGPVAVLYLEPITDDSRGSALDVNAELTNMLLSDFDGNEPAPEDAETVQQDAKSSAPGESTNVPRIPEEPATATGEHGFMPLALSTHPETDASASSAESTRRFPRDARQKAVGEAADAPAALRRSTTPARTMPAKSNRRPQAMQPHSGLPVNTIDKEDAADTSFQPAAEFKTASVAVHSMPTTKPAAVRPTPVTHHCRNQESNGSSSRYTQFPVPVLVFLFACGLLLCVCVRVVQKI